MSDIILSPLDIDISKYDREALLRLVKDEFSKCKNDFTYYANTYAKIRHPNVGVIPMTLFDFQMDVAKPITSALIEGRSDESFRKLKLIEPTFNYKKWRKEYLEMNLDLLNLIPKEIHEHYTMTVLHPQFREKVDTIILKSRQTGVSTLFQQICIWHTNFRSNVVDLIVSMSDREAKKFLNDCSTSYSLLNPLIRAKKLKLNDHELWTSISGGKAHKSIIQALPPTEDAGRSFSPNLIVLDEFAAYKKAEDVWTAISMSVSGGGLVVIIATPKGVGNLFHQFWVSVNKNFGISMPTITKQNVNDEEITTVGNSNFRPYCLHWSQLPLDEYKRRGFKDAVSWYNHMKTYVSMKEGEKAVAQELDLKFLSSGDTVISGRVLESLYNRTLESVISPTILNAGIPNLKVYEPPEEGREYMLGIDAAEGSGGDYSTIVVLKIPDMQKMEVLPKIVAEYANNTVIPRNFAVLIFNTMLLFNNAWIQPERNNAGISVIDKLMELLEEKALTFKLMNTYNLTKNTFRANEKGWDEKKNTRQFLLSFMVDFITNNYDNIYISSNLYAEFLTFIDNGRRWNHMNGFQDDLIFAYSLALISINILQKYKEYLATCNDEYAPSDIPDDVCVGSSYGMDVEKNGREVFRESISDGKIERMIKKSEFDVEKINAELLKGDMNKQQIAAKRPEHFNTTVKRVSMSNAVEEDDEYFDSF